MIETMPAELAENLIDFCENRSRVYALLSRCYETEIDAAFAEALAGEAALEQLAVVFDRAFFGMGPRTAQKAFPYESVYTSEGGLMMQDAYAEVLHVYRGAGFAKNPGFKEPEDHLAVELAFMALLCGRAVEALRAGDEAGAERQLRAQREFLSDHLLNWIDRFTSDVRKAAEDGFYFDLATFTEDFLTADAAELAEVLG